MLSLKGTLTGIVQSEKMVTKSSNRKYRVLQILQQHNGRSTMYSVRDYGFKDLPLNKPVELSVLADAWANKEGKGILSLVNFSG